MQPYKYGLSHALTVSLTQLLTKMKNNTSGYSRSISVNSELPTYLAPCHTIELQRD